MRHSSATDPIDGDAPSVVELRVHADPSQLAIVRGLLGTVASQMDFDLDTIADLRLAVDEACSHLIVRAIKGADLVCILKRTADAISVAVTAPTTSIESTVRTSFGWHVLNTLTDTVGIVQDEDPTSPDTFLTTIDFTKMLDGRSA